MAWHRIRILPRQQLERQHLDNNSLVPQIRASITTVSAAPSAARDPQRGSWRQDVHFCQLRRLRCPNSTTVERAVPSDAMRIGLFNSRMQTESTGLQPEPLTGDLQRGHLSPAQCPAGPCDPRGLGINPLVQQMWNQVHAAPTRRLQLPLRRGYNILGFKGNMAIPQTEILEWSRSTMTLAPSGTSSPATATTTCSATRTKSTLAVLPR